MTRPRKTLTPPAAVLGEEPNRHLARFKTSLARRWTRTRMEGLYEQLDLALFLWALEREDEALEILRATTTAIPEPPESPDGMINYNVWCPVAAANALQARVCRLAGDGEAAPVARIVADPGLAPNREFITGKVTEAAEKFDMVSAEKSVKWACHRLSRTLTGLVLLGELAVAGHPYATWYDSGDVETLIATGRGLLAARLSAAA